MATDIIARGIAANAQKLASQASEYAMSAEQSAQIAETAANVASVAQSNAEETLNSIPEDYTELSGSVEELKGDLVEVYDNEKTFENNGSNNYKYNFIQGHKYLVYVESEHNMYVNIFTRVNENGSNTEVIANNTTLHTNDANSFVEFSPTVDANYIRIVSPYDCSASVIDMSTSLYEIKSILHDSKFESLGLELGGILNNGELSVSKNHVRTKDYITGATKIICPIGYKVKYIAYFNNNTYKFDSAVEVNRRFITVYKENCVARVSFAKLDESDINIYDLTDDVSSLTIPLSAGSSYTVEFRFKKGQRYRISNIGVVNSAFTAFLRIESSGQNKQVISRNLRNASGMEFTPYDNYNYLYGYANAETILKIENVSNEKIVPFVQFDTDYTLKDFSVDVSKFKFDSTTMDTVYSLFDELMENNSDYITKTDCAELLGLSYPDYAIGYNTYMYTLSNNVEMYGNQSNIIKKKLLIVAGNHGNERASIYNTYLFAKRLCEADNANYYKLRSTFDIYIVPCLNGYGIINNTRANGNEVNINRNFPTSDWQLAGEDTKSQYANNYTGPSAGSEFETQIVIGLVDKYCPTILIDHHNYGSEQKFQFYTDVCDTALLPIVHQSLTDIFYSFVTNYPNYFGTEFGKIQTNPATAPSYVATSGSMMFRWAHEHGVPISATIEICQVINSVVDGEAKDYMGNDVFSVAEYTLRNQVLKLCQYALDNY